MPAKEQRFAIDEARDEFFRGCDLVIRAPASFYLSGEHSVEVGQLALLLVSDLWAYVGVSPNHDKEFTVTLTEADPRAPLSRRAKLRADKDYVLPVDLDPHIKKSLARLTTALSKWKLNNPSVPFLDIKIWTDAPFAVGFNASAAIGACMGLIMYFFERQDKIKPKDLAITVSGFGNSGYRELRNANPVFERVFLLSRWCNDVMTGRYASGAPTFASLVKTFDSNKPNSGQLIAYFTQSRDFEEHFDESAQEPDYESQLNRLRDLHWFGTRIPMRAWLAKSYGMTLLYCGTRSVPEHVHGIFADWFELQQKPFLTELSKYFPADMLNRGGSFVQPLSDLLGNNGATVQNTVEDGEDEEQTHWPLQPLHSSLGTITIYMLNTILKHGHGADKMKDLLMFNRDLLRGFRLLRSPMRKFERLIRKRIIKDQLKKECWTKSTGTANGGDLIIFAEATDLKFINERLEERFVPEWQTEPETDQRGKGSDADLARGAQLHFSSVTNGSYCPSPLGAVVVPAPSSDRWNRKLTMRRTKEAGQDRKRIILHIRSKSVSLSVVDSSGKLHGLSLLEKQERLLNLLVSARQTKKPLSRKDILKSCVLQPAHNKSTKGEQEDRAVQKFIDGLLRRLRNSADKKAGLKHLFLEQRFLVPTVSDNSKSADDLDRRGYRLNNEFVEIRRPKSTADIKEISHNR